MWSDGSTRTRYTFRNFISRLEHRQPSLTQHNLRGLRILCLTALLTCLPITSQRPIVVKRLRLGFGILGSAENPRTDEGTGRQTDRQPGSQPANQRHLRSSQGTCYKGSRIITKRKSSVSLSPRWPLGDSTGAFGVFPKRKLLSRVEVFTLT